MVLTTVRTVPATSIPAYMPVFRTNPVLPAFRASPWRIEAPLAKSFLIPESEGKRLVALHA